MSWLVHVIILCHFAAEFADALELPLDLYIIPTSVAVLVIIIGAVIIVGIVLIGVFKKNKKNKMTPVDDLTTESSASEVGSFVIEHRHSSGSENDPVVVEHSARESGVNNGNESYPVIENSAGAIIEHSADESGAVESGPIIIEHDAVVIEESENNSGSVHSANETGSVHVTFENGPVHSASESGSVHNASESHSADETVYSAIEVNESDSGSEHSASQNGSGVSLVIDQP